MWNAEYDTILDMVSGSWLGLRSTFVYSLGVLPPLSASFTACALYSARHRIDRDNNTTATIVTEFYASMILGPVVA